MFLCQARKALLRNSALVGTLSWVLLAGAAQAQQQSFSFDIPAEPLGAALRDFAHASNQQIIFSDTMVAGKSAPALHGNMTSDIALGKLLAGTDLSTQRSATGGIVVRSKNVQAASNEAAEQSLIPTETVTVTGTHIAGQAPIGAQVIVIDKSQITQQGFTSAADVVRSLPQNSNAGPSLDGAAYGSTGGVANRGGNANTGYGQGVNLRGLGSSSTLVLIDGERLAPGGTQALFTDVSGIPLSAIERVEIVPDGASAVYGSDAVGGVVNYILRKDYDGFETRFNGNITTQGGGGGLSLAATYGTHWDGGRFLLTYEFEHDFALNPGDRGITGDNSGKGGTNFLLLGEYFDSNPGTILSLSSGLFYAIPKGQNGTALTAAQFTPNTYNIFDVYNSSVPIIPENQSHKVFFSAEQDLGSAVTLFAQGLYSNRFTESPNTDIITEPVVPTNNPFYFDPSGGKLGVIVDYDLQDPSGRATALSQTWNGVVGIKANLPAGWVGTLSADYSQGTVDRQITSINSNAVNAAVSSSDPTQSLNLFGSQPQSASTIAMLTQITRTLADDRIYDVNGLLSGELFDLPGGATTAAFGGEVRRETAKGTTIQSVTLATGTVFHDQREVDSLFGEVAIPLVGAGNSLPGIERLSVSAAVRYEHYTSFGDQVTPHFGMEWSPVQSLKLNGTWGRSFRAPDFTSLDNSANTVTYSTTKDPLSPTGSSKTLTLKGGNPYLSPERATTWTLGATYTPEFIEGLRANLDYYDIHYTDRLVAPISGVATAQILTNPIFAPYVMRSPTSAQIAAACASGLNPPATCTQLPVAVIIDGRQANSSVVDTNGLDLSLTYTFSTGADQWTIGGTGTKIFTYKIATTALASLTGFLNQNGQPNDLRIRGSVGWNHGPFSAGVFVNYVDSYQDLSDAPAVRSVSSWTTFDLVGGYEFQDAPQPFAGVKLNVAIRNLFDKSPPFVDFVGGYDPANASIVGRTIGLTLTKDW